MEIDKLTKRSQVKQPESPIEWILLTWLNRYGIEYVPQYEIPPYRVDFAIPALKAVIECDGMEFHTGKERVESDKKRDEYMKKLGWNIFRFTGSEIYKNPSECVKKIIASFYKNKESYDEMQYRKNFDRNESWRKARDFLDNYPDKKIEWKM
jgi:very-short-patch-repair endonuclease